MVRFTVSCGLCLALALPAGADERPAGVLESLWNDLVAVVVEAFQPASAGPGVAEEPSASSATGEEELYPSFIPNG